MLLANFSLICASLWIGTKIYYKFIKRVRINSYRFKFFALRDRLTILVMSRKISPTDNEYLFLLKLLNSSIRVFDESYTFAGFFNYLSGIASDKATIKEIDKMIKGLKEHKNSELVSIAREYFELNHQVFVTYTRRTPLSIFLKVLARFAAPPKKRIELQEKIDARLESNLQQLSTAYA